MFPTIFISDKEVTMDREICIFQEFLTDDHKARIRAAAEAAGFVPHFFTPDQMEEAKACVQHCEVLYAHSPELLRSAPATLKWYCCSFAGVDPYCKDESIFAAPDCLLTNSAGAYGVTISEHLIMVILMLMRRMPEYADVVARRGWSNQLPVRSIQGSHFTVLGTGDIGSTFARKVKLLGAASVTGVNRSGRTPGDVFDRVLPISRLDEALPDAHVLVMALPGTPETIGILSRERIALLPADAFVVNVGRGSAIDQPALVEALDTGRIAGAALDVMTPEPLPADDPLWTARNLVLTPHVAGNMSLGYTCDRTVDMFCEDLARYAAGEPLAHLVDRKRGY